MSNWLKELRSRIEASPEVMVSITRAELRELVTSCGVADRRLRALALAETRDDVTVKRRSVLELIRSCRFQKAVEIRGQR